MPLTHVHVGGSHLRVTPKYTKRENPRVGVRGAGLTELTVLTQRFSSYQRRLEGSDSVSGDLREVTLSLGLSDDLGYRSSEVLRFHPTNSTSS